MNKPNTTLNVILLNCTNSRNFRSKVYGDSFLPGNTKQNLSGEHTVKLGRYFEVPVFQGMLCRPSGIGGGGLSNNHSLTKDYTELGRTYQLVLPLSLEGLVPNDDSVRLLSHELEDLDYTKLH